MSGYESSIINLIADNLRDRYDSGFPVIKELVQNADDARATRIVFGRHQGFPDETTHPLTAGPALWFFNNGGFKPEDCEAIRSFGINSKAGDATTIGKFGLGMKSVFHLGEAFLYLGFSDAGETVREIINPWDNKRPNHLHSGWNDVPDSAWRSLEKQAAALRQPEDVSGFFLWLPLRTHALLNGKGPIIRCFPGEAESRELDFLREASLATRLAAILGMLPHLREISFSNPKHGFDLKLELPEGSNRLALGRKDAPADSACSVVGAHHELRVAAKHVASVDDAEPFATLRKSAAWPRSFYRNPETGYEEVADDKSRAEGAVVITHIDSDVGQLTVEWAVFLPLDAHSIRIPIPNSSRHYRVTLHGQFFVDAGRKGLVGLDGWFQAAGQSAETANESALRNGWNRALVEQVVLPMLLPALEHQVRTYALKDAEIAELTQALNDWIKQFRAEVSAANLLPVICRPGVWVRTLDPRGGNWSLVSASAKLLPMPKPPESEPGRPWEIFGALDTLGTVIDVDAPAVCDGASQWDEKETLAAVRSIEVDGAFSKAGCKYLGDWLAMRLKGRLPYLKSRDVQNGLVRVLRSGLQRCGLAKVRGFAKSFSETLAAFDEQRCLGLGARDTAAATSIPEEVFEALWKVDSDVLLVPQDLSSHGPAAKPSENDLLRWLESVQPLLDDRSIGPATMSICRDLLKTLDIASRKSFLVRNKELRVLAARNVRSGKEEPLSWRQVEEFRRNYALFSFAGGTLATSSLLKKLSEVLPEQPLFQITRENLETVLGPDTRLPTAEDASGILLCIAESDSRIGSLNARSNLVSDLNLPANAAQDHERWQKIRFGMRYLLHGDRAHQYCDDSLWLRDVTTSAAWQKLWGALHEVAPWQILDESIGAHLKHGDFPRLGVHRIDRNEIQKHLREIEPSTLDPSLFPSSERAEILCAIGDPDLWRQLPLHEFADGYVGSIDAEVYRWGDTELPAGLAGCVRMLVDASDTTLSEQQRRWVPELSLENIAELALDSPAPQEYWSLLLDVLGRGGSGLDGLHRKLRQTAWLPLANGKSVAPKNVMAVAGLEDELERLASEGGYRFTTLQGLDEASFEF